MRSCLEIDALLDDESIQIIVCCGAGGVGKTTAAAALALRAAERHNRKTVVLTIDPARRLAQALGLTELDNTPREVKGVRGPSTISGSNTSGELHAMMLDMKRTFDEVVLAHTDPDRAAEIFANPFYQTMSATFAGTQEYMAMEKLGQLRTEGRWDLIVVDTPPSRSALDFLDAPARLSRFLDGKTLSLLLAPARASRSVFNLISTPLGILNRTVTKIVGPRLLSELSGFIGSLDSLFGGFRPRAEQTYRILQAPQTAFLVIAAPEPDAMREAEYFAARLAADQMPLAGLVLNRVVTVAAPAISASAARDVAGTTPTATKDRSSPLAELLAVHADLVERAGRQRAVTDWFFHRNPAIRVVAVPDQPQDIHDLDGLRTIGTALTARTSPL